MYNRKLPISKKIQLRVFANKKFLSNKARKTAKNYILAPTTRPYWGLIHHPGWLNLYTYIRYFRYRARGIPLKQTNAFHVLQNLDAFHHRIGAIGIPIAGTLLGAIRSNTFAGRPSDLDFFVILKGGGGTLHCLLV